MVARAAEHAAGVEIAILVERDFEGAVLVAEDVAALAAVVAAGEVTKVPLAGGVIANGRLVVGLQHDMLTSARTDELHSTRGT